MKKRYAKWINNLLLPVTAVLLLGYWGWLLRESLLEQYGDDRARLAGFVRWLLGFAFIFGMLVLLGWLNFRGPFRWWYRTPAQQHYYYVWLIIFSWGIFEGLQWRAERDLELVDENLAVTLAVMVFVLIFTYIADAIRARREQVKILQQKTAAELHNLRAQLNPHFLFNALNILYNNALHAENEQQAQRISELSGILRFTLQHAQQDTVPIEAEIEFLQRYTALQQARLAERPNVQLDTRFEWDGAPASIAPLLLIPFVENAFLYGVSAEQPCYIRIHLDVEDRRLEFATENSIVKTQSHRGAGQGIHNTRQRLALLYPYQHQLKIDSDEQTFRVKLTLQLDR